jgi:hypothetical protein
MRDVVGSLWENIAKLDEQAKVLRRESNDIVGFVPGEDGSPQSTISDPIRFAAIGKQFKEIAATKAWYQDKLQKIKELIGENGDGCLNSLESGDYGQANILRRELKEKVIRLFGESPHFALPSEVFASDAFKKLITEFEPEILRLEADTKRDKELAQQVSHIVLADWGEA